MDSFTILISEQLHQRLLDFFQIDNSIIDKSYHPGKRLYVNHGKVYKNNIDNFWKKQLSNGYSKKEFTVSCTICVDNLSFTGLAYQVSNKEYEHVIDFPFREDHCDVGLIQVLFPQFTSPNYQKHENEIGESVKEEVEYLIQKHKPNVQSENTNPITTKQNHEINQQNNNFDFSSFFAKHWIWIILGSLAIYGFIVQNSN